MVFPVFSGKLSNKIQTIERRVPIVMEKRTYSEGLSITLVSSSERLARKTDYMDKV